MVGEKYVKCISSEWSLFECAISQCINDGLVKVSALILEIIVNDSQKTLVKGYI